MGEIESQSLLLNKPPTVWDYFHRSSKKNEPQISTNQEFLDWFTQHEKQFHAVVKQHHWIERDFLKKLNPKLANLRSGYNLLTGMMNEETAELIITPDRTISNIVFVEELIAAAPDLEGWKFTALKPPVDIPDFGIEMAGFKFDATTLSFYANENKKFPDEIDITICYDSFTEHEEPQITNGVYIFLDNYLGELNSITILDNVTVTNVAEAEKELVPISKLKDYLVWREKEFVEKYEGVRHSTENDTYHSLQAELPNGKPLIAIINTDLLSWDSTASHPWVMVLTILYKPKNDSGMPDENTFTELDAIEENLLKELKDKDGFLNIGRHTADGERIIYFVCKDFRKPSKVADRVSMQYKDRFSISVDIFKDKYWQSLQRFNPNTHL